MKPVQKEASELIWVWHCASASNISPASAVGSVCVVPAGSAFCHYLHCKEKNNTYVRSYSIYTHNSTNALL